MNPAKPFAFYHTVTGFFLQIQSDGWIDGIIDTIASGAKNNLVVQAKGLQPEYVIPKHLFAITINQRYHAFLVSFDLNRTGAYIAPVFENNFPFRTAELTFP